MDEWEDEIIQLYAEGDWQAIIKRGRKKKNPFLPWLWPSEENLKFIAEAVRKSGCEGIVSIGCGSGLLEWLLHVSTDLPTRGVEADKSWWTSKYSKKLFIPTVFVRNCQSGEKVANSNEILLFCYFNNLSAFLDYLSAFEGNVIIVIGPGPNRGTHTIPEPFKLPDSVKTDWQLAESQEVASINDFIAVYYRIIAQ